MIVPRVVDVKSRPGVRCSGWDQAGATGRETVPPSGVKGNFFNLVKACLSLFSASFEPCLTLFAALFEPCLSLFHLGCAFFFAVFADARNAFQGPLA